MKTHRKIEQLQISRQPPLTFRHDSHKIQKPPNSSSSSSSSGKKKPVIIYVVSPEVIHVEACEFMSLVQRLTGQENNINNNSTSGSGAGGNKASTSGGGNGALNGRQLPVRVKARVLKNSTGGSSTETAGRGMISTTINQDHGHASSSSPVTGSPSPMLYFHDLSPPSFGVRKDGAMASPGGWLIHGDEFLDQNDRFQTPFLDIFNQVNDHDR